jgi:phosphatidylglycerophosphate synthase
MMTEPFVLSVTPGDGPEATMSDARRELTFLLAGPERSLLLRIAAALPRRITSDALTALGVAGAAGAGAAYALSGRHVAWLWVASLMLAVNWFGDSLDGTLARVRRIERPRYGYYLDHIVDAVATAAIGVGIGLSPWVDLEVALLLVVAYLALSINVYLESAVFGVFRLAYGRLGPTEVRLVLVIGNTVLALTAGSAPETVALVTNLIATVLAAAMLGMLVARLAQNLHRLDRLEPLPRP